MKVPPATAHRARIRVSGVVQGVGFRPFVFRLASELRIRGWVRNDDAGVVIEAEGTTDALESFLAGLRRRAPALAEIEEVIAEPVAATGESGFRIVASAAQEAPDALVSPDLPTCERCLAELFDPADRRHRYPFINCTACGPRFTIIRGVPYDRPRTTMASFEMCDACRAEYEDPGDRRFHAQPNACPVCGPRVRLLDRAGRVLEPPAGLDSVATSAHRLLDGRIVAIKGLGGYHLACRADHEQAVAELRRRKHREDKPFALMAPDVRRVRELVELSPEGEALLRSPQRPIVIAPRRPGAPVAAQLAPASRELGVMLPYAPLHHLLLADCDLTLVMTSGNLADEPIAFRDEDALRRLGSVADLFLIGDRPIHIRTDDSVLRTTSATRAGAIVLRRSRGYVPRSIELPIESERPVLGCGAELKCAFCLARGRRAWLGHHIGDLRNYETLVSFREGIDHFAKLFGLRPGLVAHDLHPDYLSTAYARELEDVELLGVQHHHAHLAACLAEHGEAGPAVGAIFDGTGYGLDGTIWGGELLVGDLRGFERVGHLLPVPMPGGEAAIREPWRMACSWLAAASGEAEPAPPGTLRDSVDPALWSSVAELGASPLSPATSSVGRLFDAFAALCGVRERVSYEGQAAVELEGIADRGERGAYPVRRAAGGEGAAGRPLVLDPRELLLTALVELERREPAARVAARFHNGLAAGCAAAVIEICERRSIATAVLSGGVFQNRLLLERCARSIETAGIRLLVPERVPANDGGIAYGQAAIAAATRRDDAEARR